jgi:hypothetical protein
MGLALLLHRCICHASSAAPFLSRPADFHPYSAKHAAALSARASIEAWAAKLQDLALAAAPAATAATAATTTQSTAGDSSNASTSTAAAAAAESAAAETTAAATGAGAAAATNTSAASTQAAAAAAAPAPAVVQPRAYEALLDEVSEHQLLIFRGKLVQDTPQVRW